MPSHDVCLLAQGLEIDTQDSKTVYYPHSILYIIISPALLLFLDSGILITYLAGIAIHFSQACCVLAAISQSVASLDVKLYCPFLLSAFKA